MEPRVVGPKNFSRLNNPAHFKCGGGRHLRITAAQVYVKLLRMQRRQFLILSAASIGGVLVYSLDRRASRLFAQEKSTQTLKIPLRFFKKR
jgi:hypothetical protein